jgi:UrcA family protein
MSGKVLLLSAAFLAAAAPNLAPAEEAIGKVALAGLDVSTPGGSAELHKRLAITAQRLCRHFRDDRKASDWETYADCVRDTLASALEQIKPATSTVAKN